MKRAVIAIKEQPHYRADAFRAGLTKLGYKIEPLPPPHLTPDDVYVCWNLHAEHESIAKQYRAAGGKVLVAENGYVGVDSQGRQLYALARDAHNGAGKWPAGDGSRWAAQFDSVRETLAADRARMDAWRKAAGGSYVLICAQRGIGSSQMRSPEGWHHTVAAQVQAMGLPYRVRLHPGALFGDAKNQPPLEQELAGARCVLIWSSSSGVKALLHHIPVVYCAPYWICQGAAGWGVHAVKDAAFDADKARVAFERMAWAQWSVDEIQTGEPLALLLGL